MTPHPLAAAIIAHFAPRGTILDPCRGQGAFYDQFPPEATKDWCELSEGRDFLTHPFAIRYDWCISNPPWSKWRVFNQRAMVMADNVVWLCLVNAVFMKARLRDMDEAGFAIKEIALVPTPPAPWPQAGFCLGAVWLKRGHVGPIDFSKIDVVGSELTK